MNSGSYSIELLTVDLSLGLSAFTFIMLLPMASVVYLKKTPLKKQVYGHLSPITKTMKVRRIRHAGHCWRSKDELISSILVWIPSHRRAKVGRPARTYIQPLYADTGCCLKTFRKRWTIETCGEKGSGRYGLAQRHDDDDDENLMDGPLGSV